MSREIAHGQESVEWQPWVLTLSNPDRHAELSIGVLLTQPSLKVINGRRHEHAGGVEMGLAMSLGSLASKCLKEQGMNGEIFVFGGTSNNGRVLALRWVKGVGKDGDFEVLTLSLETKWELSKYRLVFA